MFKMCEKVQDAGKNLTIQNAGNFLNIKKITRNLSLILGNM